MKDPAEMSDKKSPVTEMDRQRSRWADHGEDKVTLAKANGI